MIFLFLAHQMLIHQLFLCKSMSTTSDTANLVEHLDFIFKSQNDSAGISLSNRFVLQLQPLARLYTITAE